jgi:hypothetical protein
VAGVLGVGRAAGLRLRRHALGSHHRLLLARRRLRTGGTRETRVASALQPRSTAGWQAVRQAAAESRRVTKDRRSGCLIENAMRWTGRRWWLPWKELRFMNRRLSRFTIASAGYGPPGWTTESRNDTPAVLLLLPLLGSARPERMSQHRRAIATLEKRFDQRLSRAPGDDPFELLGPVRSTSTASGRSSQPSSASRDPTITRSAKISWPTSSASGCAGEGAAVCARPYADAGFRRRCCP